MDQLEFMREASKKWLKGRRERGNPLDAPFEGNPAFELKEEMLDSRNYLDEMLKQGIITEESHYHAVNAVFSLALLADTAARR